MTLLLIAAEAHNHFLPSFWHQFVLSCDCWLHSHKVSSILSFCHFPILTPPGGILLWSYFYHILIDWLSELVFLSFIKCLLSLLTFLTSPHLNSLLEYLVWKENNKTAYDEIKAEKLDAAGQRETELSFIVQVDPMLKHFYNIFSI